MEGDYNPISKVLWTIPYMRGRGREHESKGEMSRRKEELQCGVRGSLVMKRSLSRTVSFVSGKRKRARMVLESSRAMACKTE